jgi:signal transduction histidine kinase
MTGSEARKEMLLQAGLALASELSLETVLQRIVDLARQITGAHYGALGVLGPDRRIQQFITAGIDDETRRAIGHYPTGGGLLGALIEDAKPLRLADISKDPRSVGFPPHHPPMKSFLGAPVKALGSVYGNIYLTEKEGAPEFTREDEEDLLVLATQAGVAVANAHLYAEARLRERWLDASSEITSAILAGVDITGVLDVVADRARELADGDLATIATPGEDPGSLVVTAASGLLGHELRGMRFSAAESLSGESIRQGSALVIEDASSDPHLDQPIVRAGTVGPALLVPLRQGESAFGSLTVANAAGGKPIAESDVRLVSSFAAQASIALEYARVREKLERLVVLEDRERIAKELHDGVIQALFAVGMGLQGTAMLAGDEGLARRIEGAVGELDRVIRDLRNYIFGLRPGILADRQLGQALQELAGDFESKSGVTTVVDIDGDAAAELASRAGDVVQLAREALSNVGRHASAATCRLSLRRQDGSVILEIDDDGSGFDQEAAQGSGSGLANLEGRAAALGGTLRVESVPGQGTTVRLDVPV